MKVASTPADAMCLEREAEVYRRLVDDGHRIADHTPRVQGRPTPDVLALELLRPAVVFSELLARSDRELVPAAEEIGRVLGLLHEVPDGGADAPLPPVFALARPGLGAYAGLSQVNLDCLSALQEAGTDGLLDDLAAQWQPSCLVHGDIRPANIMVEVTGGNAPAVWLIDWESAGAGDPCWDVGCLLAHHLSVWIDSLPQGPGMGAADLTARAGRPLGTLKPAMAAAWRGWASRRPPSAGQEELVRAVRFTGAALVEIVFALGQDAWEASDAQFLHLQVAHNILSRPIEDALHLIGLGPPANGIPAR